MSATVRDQTRLESEVGKSSTCGAFPPIEQKVLDEWRVLRAYEDDFSADKKEAMRRMALSRLGAARRA